MKILFKIGFLLFFPFLLMAQSQPLNLDSLHQVLEKAPSDTFRMKIYDQLGWAYAEINRDSALHCFERELIIAKKLNLKIYEAASLTGIGYAMEQLGNSPKALESYLEAQKIASSPAAEKNPWYLTNNTWNTVNSLDPKIARLNLLGWNFSNMGGLYEVTGNSDKQISNLFQARNIASSIQDTTLLEVVNGILGDVYFRLNKLDSALLFCQRALFLYESSDVFKKYEGRVLLSIGRIYQKKGKFDFSKNAFLKAAKSSEHQDNLTALGASYLSLAELYHAEKNTDSSMFYARKALGTFKKVNKSSGISDTYSLFSSIYFEQNKPDSAFAYLKSATVIKDSLNNAERTDLLEFKNKDFDVVMQLKEMEEEKTQTRTKIRTFALLSGIGVFILITFMLYRNNKHRKKANALLQKQNEEIELQKRNVEGTLDELRDTQAQLIQSEKMASLGALTAGIAHEIQNPLNFVNNFSEVNKELIEELKSQKSKLKSEEVDELLDDIAANSEKINHHGKRAGDIVKGMLQHSRTSSGQKELTDINVLCDEYLRLSFHGLRAKDKSFNAKFESDFDTSLSKINIVPQDIGRVILNLINNAFFAVNEKQKQNIQGFEPTVTVKTLKNPPATGGGRGAEILISVRDNGPGIPKEIIDKIFQPFFTTKPTGQGTGLSLSLSYDIVKAHGGEIKVETKIKEGTEFIIQLPL